MNFDIGRMHSAIDYFKCQRVAPTVIIVGGTNGKGTVVECISKLAMEQSKKVGTYTSPHLFSFNERIKINDEPISDEDIAIVSKQIKRYALKINREFTYFEMATLIMALHFRNNDLDIAVLEIGLGGRLDAVNCFERDSAVITSVDYDHCDILGSQLEDITREKGGIFKPNCSAFCGTIEHKSLLSQKCTQSGIPLTSLDDYQIYIGEKVWTLQGPDLDLTLPYPKTPNTITLKNISLGLIVASKHFEISSCRNVVKYFDLIGRQQISNIYPKLLYDVSHNPSAVTHLVESLCSSGEKNPITAICGFNKDKDVKGMISQFSRLSIDCWYPIEITPPRGMDMPTLTNIVSSHSQSNIKHTSLQNALESSISLNKDIVVFGSFDIVAKSIGYIENTNEHELLEGNGTK